MRGRFRASISPSFEEKRSSTFPGKKCTRLCQVLSRMCGNPVCNLASYNNHCQSKRKNSMCLQYSRHPTTIYSRIQVEWPTLRMKTSKIQDLCISQHPDNVTQLTCSLHAFCSVCNATKTDASQEFVQQLTGDQPGPHNLLITDPHQCRIQQQLQHCTILPPSPLRTVNDSKFHRPHIV